MDLVAPRDPKAALDLLWRFAACGQSVLERSDDGSGRLGEIFCSVAEDIGPVAVAARADPLTIAEQAFEAVRYDEYGVYDRLIPALAPALGANGLARIRDLATAWQAEPVVTPPQKDRKAIGWGSGGALFADQIDTSHRKHASARLLKEVADACGDVDAWIAQYDAKGRRVPAIAAGIAERLLAAGRADEAWTAIEASEAGRGGWVPPEWEKSRLAVLDALGRHEDAHAFRWERFTTALDTGHLRAYLQRLPDFEDFDAEQRALAHSRAFPDVHRALAFLTAWPALDRAASLVLERPDAIDSNLYELLTPAAEALEPKYPLAATVLRRAMIDFTLTNARSSRYRHAARHLAECAGLARRIIDHGALPDHDRYLARLRADHGRKPGFWREVDGQ
ncbi:hypothetical protein QLH51_12865 [Sphingomonas sp. 2R-10]|nr:DUF6880 family protein [Sphingomonas sp. 2R-10]MDJ0277689.1 hypothetical protein [Sphingomonas sp. 2R-10]